MSSRPRPGAVPAGRIRELLARPPGWTPAPLPGDGAALEDDGPPRAAVSWAAARDAGGPVDGPDELDGPANNAGGSVDGLDGPTDALPRHSTTTGHGGPGDGVDGPRAASRSARTGSSGSADGGDGPDAVPGRSRLTGRPAAPAGPPAAPDELVPPGPVSRAAAFLPAALRTGRLDPGRRGAAALVLAAVLAAVVAGAVVLRGRPQEVLVPQVLSTGSPVPGASAAADPQAQVVVSVSGKVVRPGLVRLPAGSRVVDALRAAGGPAPGVTTGLLNLARRLVDGEQVLVGVDPRPAAPATGTTTGGAPGPASGAAAPGGLLDLNTATASDLDALPGIGPVLAQRIVDWRTEHERFASVDQLREVTGIGEAKYDDLKAEVTV